jgi:hypothetical protein
MRTVCPGGENGGGAQAQAGGSLGEKQAEGIWRCAVGAVAGAANRGPGQIDWAIAF